MNDIRLSLLSADDPDPWPRPATVSAASAFAAVAAAKPAVASAARVEAAGSDVPRRLAPLRTWQFTSELAGQKTTVAVPDVWSRRDPGLADHRGPCRYQRSVTAGGPFARLLLSGVDYLAQVLVDGEQRAVHEGGFAPIAVDIPCGRPVEVVVVVSDPAEPELLKPNAAMAPKRKVKGVHEWHDSRPGGLGTGHLFRPHWAVRWGTGGMTGPAFVHETGAVRIDAVFVTPMRAAGARAGAGWRLRISWVVTNLDAEARDVVLSAALGGQEVQAAVRLPPGAGRCSIVTGVDGVLPWTVDAPHLYQVRAAVTVAGEPSDGITVPLGFRTIEMDVAGERQFQLALNGRRTYLRAANYIGSVWPPELTPELVERDVRLARQANLNALGVHASSCPPIYDVADRLGLLVQQDFPLQWSYLPDAGPMIEAGPTFREASLQLAAEMVYDLYNHPSLVYWCGHNEPGYQLAEAFAKVETVALPLELSAVAAYIQQLPDESEVDEARAALFRLVDPTRPAVQASGLGGSRQDGDTHEYKGSLSGGHVSEGRFGQAAYVSEYGVWSANFSAAQRAVGAVGDWPPPPGVDAEWYEQTHYASIQSAYAGTPERYEDFATWCFAGQLWAGWHAKVCTEMCRAAWFAPSAGQRWHFLVDYWGDGGAGVVDRLRTTGPAFRGLAAANRPLLPIVPPPPAGRVVPGTPLRLPLVVVNDTGECFTGPVTWRVARLGPGDAFVIGADLPDCPGPPSAPTAPPGHVCVLPRRPGETVTAGVVDAHVGSDSAATVAEIGWTADITGPIAVFVQAGDVANWTSFVVAAPEWRAQPGLAGPRRFRVTSQRPGQLRRRWTGEPADMAAAPPDQYMLGGLAVDVFDDVHIRADGSVVTVPLPWPAPEPPEPEPGPEPQASVHG